MVGAGQRGLWAHVDRRPTRDPNHMRVALPKQDKGDLSLEARYAVGAGIHRFGALSPTETRPLVAQITAQERRRRTAAQEEDPLGPDCGDRYGDGTHSRSHAP